MITASNVPRMAYDLNKCVSAICGHVQERLNLEYYLHSRDFSFKSVFTDMKLTDVNGKCMMVNSRMRCN